MSTGKPSRTATVGCHEHEAAQVERANASGCTDTFLASGRPANITCPEYLIDGGLIRTT